MSLYKVLTKTKVVQQELKHTGVGGFVWCEEGFKWIGSDRGEKSENERKNADVDLRQTSSDSEKNLICKSTDDGTGTATNWRKKFE